MTASNASTAFYDRSFMLSEAQRNRLLELWEIQKYGADNFADPEYVCIYGMRPDGWYGRGIRLLARTTLEAVHDRLGDRIGTDVAKLVGGLANRGSMAVVDPFAGSCNALYWLLRHLPDADGLAFEADRTICQLTRRNLAHLDRTITLVEGDYRARLGEHAFPAELFLVVFVAPPWGDALDPEAGLDLRLTQPPVAEIVAHFEGLYPDNPVLYVIQTHQNLVPDSLADLERSFEWSRVTIYDINEEGMKHGAILGANRWQPSSPR